MSSLDIMQEGVERSADSAEGSEGSKVSRRGSRASDRMERCGRPELTFIDAV